MRKNDLIKLLQDLPGNPEMVLWNGYVSDYMQIDRLVDSNVVKYNYDYFLEMCRLEECNRLKNWEYQLSEEEVADCKRAYRQNHEWDVNPYVTEEDVKEKRYKSKRVVYINAKLRGKTMGDRLGTVSY